MITIDNFVGNRDLIRLLRISIVAAKETNSALPHTLLKGPAGTGKTTLAESIAREFDTTPMVLTAGTAKDVKELRKLFLRMPGEGYDQDTGRIIGKIQPQIVFIDEIHQLPLVAQENLGIAMQDWKLPVRIADEDVFEWVPRFSLIGATTLAGKLSKPFLDRFKIQADFETYTLEESIQIAQIQAKNLGLTLAQGVDKSVAKRSRGVARFIVRFLERIKDAAIVAAKSNPTYKNIITLDLAEHMFREFLKIDDRGLTKADLKILKQLAKTRDPVGLDTLAAITNEDRGTVERAIEPYLVQEGLLARTKRGRVLTDEGRRYLESEGYTDPSLRLGRVGRLMGEAKQ